MSHTIRRKAQLLNRVRRIGGQIGAVERALAAEAECSEVLQLIASVRGALNGLIAEVMEEHVRTHMEELPGLVETDRAQGADKLMDVIRTYLR
jgi:FrmR/RcnR family transcriptional regulator, repressor of frmRAB operon